MTVPRTPPGTPDDEGITLVELIVVIVVSALFLGLIAGLFANGLNAQNQATARDRATGQANVLSASLTSSIRNAVAARVAADGKRVDATVRTSAGWECRAWVLDGTSVLYSAGDTARTAAPTGWTALAKGVSGTLSGGALFAGAGDRRVSIGIRITDTAQTAVISDGVTAQAVGTGWPTC